MRRKKPVQVLLRLYADQDDDLIAWLESLGYLQFGVKSQAVKDALRRGIGSGDVASQPAAVGAAPALDLAELRQVVEAAVDTALGRFEGHIGGTRAAPQEEDDETEALLDDLEAALVLDEDEQPK